MKKYLVIGGIVLAVAALIVFSNLTSKKNTVNSFAEVKKGLFEITVTNSGELMAEKSVDITGPVMGVVENQQAQSPNQGQQRQGQQGQQGQGGNRQGGSGGNTGGGAARGGSSGGGGGAMMAMGGMGGRGGGDMHAMDLKILSIVPEGTIVKAGDFVAQLDRSSYENTLKDELTALQTLQTTLRMKLLDTAVTLSNQRDDIKNARYAVDEAKIVEEQSQFEPPAIKRQARMNVERAQRAYEQKQRIYSLIVAQNISAIQNQEITISSRTRRVKDIQDFLSKFTVTAPSSGMVIYKKDRSGAKRKEGSQINSFDGVVATLPDLSTMISKMYVNEIEISKVKLGQKVNVVIDAFPKKAYTGEVSYIANVGEQLPNSDAKMFEVQVKLDGTDMTLRPAMTTGNKILIKSYNDVIYLPTECVQAGIDSIPYVYLKNRTKHIVILGDANDKNVIIKQGLEPGTTVYSVVPPNAENFKVIGSDLIAQIKGKK
jgi:HlyD family secretion protein